MSLLDTLDYLIDMLTICEHCPKMYNVSINY
jgi:hypothetical protein